MENTNSLIAVFDGECRYEYVSPSHQRLLGFSSDELLGTSGSMKSFNMSVTMSATLPIAAPWGNLGGGGKVPLPLSPLTHVHHTNNVISASAA